jgi:leucyl aminopeptidase
VVGAVHAAFYLTPDVMGAIGPAVAGQVMAEGLGFGAWYFGEMKRPPEDPKPGLESVQILAPADTASVEKGHRLGAAIAAGQTLTRGLQMLPGNVCTPTYLGQQAEELGRRHGIKVTVLDLAAIRREGMGGLLCVAQGGIEEPRFIILEYQGGSGAPVVLVGKGVTFDTGGISIKPAQNMEEMKFDMSGAAAVLGTFEMLGRLKPKVNVVGLIPSTENMPSGSAIKPGDVVKSHLGKTIEIINTDAEGRLILCDALSWARRYEPACVLDTATLTGAVVIALGHTASGVLGTDDGLIAEVQAAGERAGERVWPLPLWEEYRELIKSDIADVKNSGGRPAGTITGAWFLKEFVEGFPWAHLDIAGTAYTEREDATMVKGPTGVMVRLFSEFLLARAGK